MTRPYPTAGRQGVWTPWAALGVLGVSAATLYGNFHWSWIRVLAGNPWRFYAIGRDQLAALEATPYEQGTLLVPPVALAGLMVGALAVCIVRFIALARLAPAIELASGAVVALSGFMLSLTGTRWLGFYVARLWDPGPPILHLALVPYLNLFAGLMGLALGLRLLWPMLREAPLATGLAAGIAAGGALLTPILPHATVPLEGGGLFHLDELTLETERAALARPGSAILALLPQARTTVFFLLAYLSVVLVANHRRPEWTPTLMLPVGVVGMAGLLLWVKFVYQIDVVYPDADAFPHPVHPAVHLGVVACWFWGLREAAAPGGQSTAFPRGKLEPDTP